MNQQPKHIGFLVWYQIFDHMDELQQNSIIKLLSEVCSNIEKEINDDFARSKNLFKFKIHFVTVPEKSETAINKFEKYLENNSEILFICQAPNFFKCSDDIVKRFKNENFIIFDAFDMFKNNNDWNFFSTNRNNINVENQLNVIDALFTPKTIFYFSDKKPLKQLKKLNCKIDHVDISEFESQTPETINSTSIFIADQLNKIGADDVIFFPKTRLANDFVGLFLNSKTQADLILSRFDPREAKVLIDQHITKFKHKNIFHFDEDNYHIYLKLKEFLNGVDLKLSELDKAYINCWHKKGPDNRQ